MPRLLFLDVFTGPDPYATAEDALNVAANLLESADHTGQAVDMGSASKLQISCALTVMQTHIAMARKALTHIETLQMRAEKAATEAVPAPEATSDSQQDQFAKAIGLIALEAIRRQTATTPAAITG